MLIEFRFGNYRSFRDETVLSMEATGLSTYKSVLIPYKSTKLLPSAVIYGKNGGGKSNVIRAFWLAVQFILNAQRTQHEKASVPVQPFLLDDVSKDKPTFFEFTYVLDEIKYVYGFSATKSEIVEEYLYHSPKGQSAMVFSREYQKFTFRDNQDKKRRELISEAVAPNQLYFAVACTMNEKACVEAMRWFREHVFFSRDYADIPQQFLEYSENPNMLRAISDYAKMADIGIREMEFKVQNKDISGIDNFPEDIPEGVRAAMVQFMKALSEVSDTVESKLKVGEVKATSYHQGISADGSPKLYPLNIGDESDGTRKLMSIAPGIENVLACGGVLLVDELEKELHPLLMELIVSKFQSPSSNPKRAQLIFTTHNTELLNMELIRKDQVYFADKNREDGASELYSISDFSTPTSENVRKGYLVGKYGAIPDLEIEEVE